MIFDLIPRAFSRPGILFLSGAKNILKKISKLFGGLIDLFLSLIYQITIKKQNYEISKARNRKEKRKIFVFNR